MTPSYNNETSLKDEVGAAIILMTDEGPQIYLKLSDIDEISSIYLTVKGFTAIMTGFETNAYGPGKIRGILQIPSTDYFAVAMDINIRGTGFEEDSRLRINRNGLFCLIVTSKQLAIIRKYYSQTELFLIEKLKAAVSVNHFNEEFCKRLISEYIKLLSELQSKDQSKDQLQNELYSLFDVSTLLTLPKDENITARIIIESSINNIQGITSDQIKKITKRNEREEQQIINRLLEKGLIVAIPSSIVNEPIKYIAQ